MAPMAQRVLFVAVAAYAAAEVAGFTTMGVPHVGLRRAHPNSICTMTDNDINTKKVAG